MNPWISIDSYGEPRELQNIEQPPPRIKIKNHRFPFHLGQVNGPTHSPSTGGLGAGGGWALGPRNLRNYSRSPSRSPPRGPRAPQDSPGRPPRGPQDAPRGPKTPPRRPQDAPKRPQDALRTPPGPLKILDCLWFLQICVDSQGLRP